MRLKKLKTKFSFKLLLKFLVINIKNFRHFKIEKFQIILKFIIIQINIKFYLVL